MLKDVPPGFKTFTHRSKFKVKKLINKEYVPIIVSLGLIVSVLNFIFK